MGVPYAEVIGDPVAHSRSPAIHQFWLEKLGLEGEYRATRVGPDTLAGFLSERRADPDWRGCNVTMPLKSAALSLMDGLLPGARAAGAVNTVMRFEGNIVGDNTDLRGFAEPFRDRHRGRGSALVIGSGAAARSALIALAGLGFGPIQLASRDRARGQALLDTLGRAQSPLALDRPLPPVDLLVNASAMGMGGEPGATPDLSLLAPTAIVYDIVYDPLETPLLAAARGRGLRTIDGITMLIGQAAAAFPYFFERRPPRMFDWELRGRLVS